MSGVMVEPGDSEHSQLASLLLPSLLCHHATYDSE